MQRVRDCLVHHRDGHPHRHRGRRMAEQECPDHLGCSTEASTRLTMCAIESKCAKLHGCRYRRGLLLLRTTSCDTCHACPPCTQASLAEIVHLKPRLGAAKLRPSGVAGDGGGGGLIQPAPLPASPPAVPLQTTPVRAVSGSRQPLSSLSVPHPSPAKAVGFGGNLLTPTIELPRKPPQATLPPPEAEHISTT